ncbi:hypothetical protein BGZ83_007282 [Gryganskiella cystojenkinii]|nr:hypothetical protein BGZ83_007282 [Gryganskiella cystojenkinii]
MSSLADRRSLATFTAGQGLATLAHIHLFRLNFSWTREYYSSFLNLHDRCELQIFRRSVHDLSHTCNAMSEVLILLRKLDKQSQRRVLEKKRALNKSRRTIKGRRAERTSKWPSLSSSSSSLSPHDGHILFPDNNSHDEWTDSDGSASEEEGDFGLPTYTINADDLERLRDLYKECRKDREHIKNTTLGFLVKIDRGFLEMRTSALLSTILGGVVALRSLFARYGTRIVSFGERIGNKISHLFLPRTSLVPWGFGSNTTNTSQHSNSVAAHTFIPTLLLPLVPTICLSVMHFAMTSITRWAISNMRRETRRTVRMANRAITTLELIEYREKRLTWIIDEIRAYEQTLAELEEQQGATTSDSDSDETSSPSTPSTPSPRPTRPFALSDQDAFKQAADFALRPWRVQSPPPSAASAPVTFYRVFLKRPKRQELELENLNMNKFLSEPQERDRVLKIELKAVAEEQRLFFEGQELSSRPSSARSSRKP